MSNQQKQPDDPPAGGAKSTDNPPSQGHDGIAQGQEQFDPAGRPSSARQDTETAPNKIESDKS